MGSIVSLVSFCKKRQKGWKDFRGSFGSPAFFLCAVIGRCRSRFGHLG
jgi:hypothetical protein